VTTFTPGNHRPIEWLFLDARTTDRGLAEWLAASLPHCAWSCHLVITGGDGDDRLLETVVHHLEREPVALVHFHPVVDGTMDPSPRVDRLLDAAARFQTEAYRERTGSRLVPLPILEVAHRADPRPALTTAGELAGRLAKPSLLMWDEPAGAAITTAAELGLRLYLGSEEQQDSSIMDVLTAAHVLDSTMDGLSDGGSILGPCRPHLTVVDGRVFGCAQQWRLGRTADDHAPEWRPDTSLCAGCVADTIVCMRASLVANQRRNEGRELALRTSAALVDKGAHNAAAVVARTAAKLSLTEPEKADALIQAGLCRLAGGDVANADRELLEASEAGAPAGLVAYHRARVQVAWRDDIEALDRFAEALELGTKSVSSADLHVEMALSHIRLEEWADARTHLERAGGPSAAIAFNLGVCDVNDARAARALEHFDRALELAPPDEDLGRIRFFRGFCLKELERYEEAVEDLRLSIELEEPELAHHNSLGFCLFKLGRHAEAVASFERAVEVDPSSAIDWANIGVNLERLGEHRRAAEMYRKGLGMDASIAFARDGLERIERG